MGGHPERCNWHTKKRTRLYCEDLRSSYLLEGGATAALQSRRVFRGADQVRFVLPQAVASKVGLCGTLGKCLELAIAISSLWGMRRKRSRGLTDEEIKRGGYFDGKKEDE